MTEKQIAKKTKHSQSTTHKKLRSLTKGRMLHVKKKKIDIGKYNKNRVVKHYKAR